MRFPIAAAVLAVPLPAQWLHFPTPGIPRTADGKPNLSAPAPRAPDGKPDLSGLWNRKGDRYDNNIAADLKPGDVLPWADALYQRRRGEYGKDSMDVRCLPIGPVASTTAYRDLKIIQTPTLIAILLSDMTYRQIHLDGRKLEKDPSPNWMGYSVGRWEGDALVVESNGYTDRSWLDYDGHPHTEELRVTERFFRRDFGHMDVDVTLVDPGAYAGPWTVAVPLELFPDTEILESVCRENEKDSSHMTSQVSESKKFLTVAPEILAKYAGSYEVQERSGKLTPAELSVSGDALFLDLDHTGRQQIFPMSETSFSYSGTVIEFIQDGQGAVTHFLIHEVEGQDKAIRKR